MVRQTNQANLSIILDAVEDDTEIKQEPAIIIPQTKFDMGGIKGYSQKRIELKQQIKIKETISELKHALSIFHPDEIRLNHSLVLFVAQIVEDIFTGKGLGSVKHKIVVDVCKEYFNDSPDLVAMVIDLVFVNVLKTSLYRRNKTRVANLFFWLLKHLGGSVDVRYQTNFKTSLGH